MELKELDITERKIRQFSSRGIDSVEMLQQFFPRDYYDFTSVTKIQPSDQISCLLVDINGVASYNNTIPVLIAAGTLSGTEIPLRISWFHQNFLYNEIKELEGSTVFVAGKVTYNESYQVYNITMPLICSKDIPSAQRIHPVYPKIQGMSQTYLQEKIALAIEHMELIEDRIPEEYRKKYDLLDKATAYQQLHQPTSMDMIDKARERIIYDELFQFAVDIEKDKMRLPVGSPFQLKDRTIVSKMISNLPFKLTKDQSGVVSEMIRVVQSGKRVNALVQGDVGSGKTIIAILLLAAFAVNGYQTVLMAPTQALAQQHYEEVKERTKDLGLNTVMLGGSGLKRKEKEALLKEIEYGNADIIVGTHSVLSNSVTYHNLALVIADEEHKFGVSQRETLISKAAAGVHSLTMSATPIPRSLAQVLYGSAVELYTIKSKPADRKPVITGVATSREKLYRAICAHKRQGHQTYVVCPLIEKTDKMQGVKSVDQIREEFRAALPHEVAIGTLSGRDKADVSEKVIHDFKSGAIDVLISTTVVEVGINVPTATIMVIMNAERFGLAQMHQLRGRVGRGPDQSYCVLDVTNPTEDAIRKIQAMVNSNDGFEIAKEDLRIRGTGDLLGTKQTGHDKYIGLIISKPEIYKHVQEIASSVMEEIL